MLSFVCWAGNVYAQSSKPYSVKYVSAGIDKQLGRNIKQLAERGKRDSISIILSDEGYLDHSLAHAGDTLVIDPGLRYQLGDVDLTIVNPDGQIERKNIANYRSRNASLHNMAGIRDDILLPFQQQGHYFATLNTDRISIREGKVLPQLRLIAGPLVEIQRVRFKGLRKTDPEFVRKLSGVRESDIFTRELYLKAMRRIEGGDFLRNDSLPQITPNQNFDGVELLFYVSELRSNRLELGGGYLPGRGSEKGEFVGRMRLESINLFGSGRRINLMLDRKDRASSQVDILFGQPFFIPDHLELALHFSQVDYDSSYHSFTIDSRLSLITRGNTRIGGGLSWTKTEPQKSSQPPSRILSGGIEYDAQKLDYRPNPSSGRHLKIGLSYIRRSSWPDSVVTTVINNESMFEIAADNYFRIGRNVIIRLNIETQVLITSRPLIDFSEQFKLGGFGSLRGYRQDQFAGRRTALGQAEIRVRPSSSLAAYLFFDAGIVYSKREVKPGMVDSENLERAGSGAGLYIGSSSVRMTLEIGWGRNDRADEGKVHFGLITLF
jgi:outer membrane protein assembly factor BamA